MTNWLLNLDAFKCKQAFKTALAATMATLITLAFHMPNPFWAPSIVIMLLDTYAEGSFQKGVTRLSSTIAGAAFAYFLGHFTLDHQLAYYVSLFVVISTIVYGFLVYGSAWLNFGVTFLFLTMYMVLDPSGSFQIAIWRSSEILTGVLCCIITANFIFPSNLANDIDTLIQNLTRESKKLINSLQANNAIDSNTWRNEKVGIKEILIKLETTQEILAPMGLQSELYNTLTCLIEKSWVFWRQTGRITEISIQNPSLQQLIDLLFQSFSDLISTWIADIDQPQKIISSGDFLSAQLNQILVSLEPTSANTRTQADYLLVKSWSLAADDWLEILKQALNHETITLDPANQLSLSLKEKLHRFYVMLSSKKNLIPHCMSIGVGCCMVTYIWLLTGWPGGVCAGISALVVGADSNLTKINLKIRLRLLGSILGSALGLLLYILFVKTTLSMCVVVFLGVAFFTYLSQKDFSSMYISWMATMGFIITVVPDARQITDISFSFERAFGLVMGLVVMAFVVNFFWPLNDKKQFQAVCDTIKKKIAIVWSLLGNLNAQNMPTTLNNMSRMHQELSLQMNEGSAIAKSNKIMPIWLPIMDMIVTLPWLSSHSTPEALIYLNSHYPNQWSMYCQQTYEAILAPTADSLLIISQQWGEWAHELDSADQNKNTVAQCFLMLQANQYFCDSLAKSALNKMAQ